MLQNAKVLFVQDHPQLIAELVELLQIDQPDWQFSFALDTAEVIGLIEEGNAFDLVIMDDTLPNWGALPRNTTAIHLASWLLGLNHSIVDWENDQPKPLPKLTCRPQLVFLASWDIDVVQKEWKRLNPKVECPAVISRLNCDENQIIKVIQKA